MTKHNWKKWSMLVALAVVGTGCGPQGALEEEAAPLASSDGSDATEHGKELATQLAILQPSLISQWNPGATEKVRWVRFGGADTVTVDLLEGTPLELKVVATLATDIPTSPSTIEVQVPAEMPEGVYTIRVTGPNALFPAYSAPFQVVAP